MFLQVIIHFYTEWLYKQHNTITVENLKYLTLDFETTLKELSKPQGRWKEEKSTLESHVAYSAWNLPLKWKAFYLWNTATLIQEAHFGFNTMQPIGIFLKMFHLLLFLLLYMCTVGSKPCKHMIPLASGLKLKKTQRWKWQLSSDIF